MSIVFGWNLIAMPSYPAPASVEWGVTDKVAVAESTFTGQQQTQDWQATLLEASISMPPLTHAQSQQWAAFLIALRGRKNVFQFGDPLALTPRGTGAGTPVVNGAGQTGYTLLTRGWADGSTVLLAGDWLQIGYRIYRNLFDVTADGSGYASLSVSAPIRDLPLDGTAIILNGAKGLWRLKKNERNWSVDKNRMYGVQFDIQEAI